MKLTILILLFLISVYLQATAQGAEQTEPDTLFETYLLQKMPVFPGGEAVLMNYLMANINWPAGQNGNYGCSTFAFQFIVAKDGSIRDITTLRGAGERANAIISVLEAMPCWQPGECNGKPVSTKFALPIRIRFQ